MNQEREHGFTFVEIISVLVIMGILGAVALPDFFNIQDRIRRKMIDNVIRDLNHREYLIWITYSESSPDHDDGVIFNQVNPENIGAKFAWSDGPNKSGVSTISFGSIDVNVQRIPSTAEGEGVWNKLGSDALDSGSDSQNDEQKDGNSEEESSPGQSGNAPGQGGSSPGQSGNAPGQGGQSPGQSGNASGKNKN